MTSKPVAQTKIAPTVLADAEYEHKWAEESQYQMLRRSHDPRFGEIIIYKKRGTNELVFAKEKLSTSKQAAAADIRELKSRMALNRPGLQKMIGYSTSVKKELCSTSYLTQGFYEFPRSDLGKEVSSRAQNAGNFSEQELTAIAQQSLNGLNSLHQERISHGDIRPQYIGISHATNQAEILDRLADPAPVEKVQTGHIVNKKNLYMSPELYKKLQGKDKMIKYDPAKNDLYGLGLSILEAGNGRSIQDIYSSNGTINQANLDKHLATFNQKYPNGYLSQLVGGTLAQNESARLSTAELVSRLGSAGVGSGATGYGFTTQTNQFNYPQFSSTVTQETIPQASVQTNYAVTTQTQAGQGLFDFTAKDAEAFDTYSNKVNQSQSTVPSFLQDQQTNAYLAEKPVAKEIHVAAQPHAIKAQATVDTTYVEKPTNTSTVTQTTFQNQSIPQVNQSFSSQANVQPQVAACMTHPTQTLTQTYVYEPPQVYNAPTVQTSYTQAPAQPLTTSQYTSQYTPQYTPAVQTISYQPQQSYTVPASQYSQSYILQPSAPVVSTTQTYTVPATQPITITNAPITTYISQSESRVAPLQRVSYATSSPVTIDALAAPAPVQTTHISSYPATYISELPQYLSGSTRVFNAPISTEALPVIGGQATIRPLTPVTLPTTQTYTTYTTQQAVRPLTPQISSYSTPSYAKSERVVTNIGSTGATALTGYYQPGAIFAGSQTNILPATTEIKSRKSVSFIDHEPSKIDYNNIIKSSNSGNYVSQSAQVISLPATHTTTTSYTTQPITTTKSTISWEEFQALKKNDQSIQIKEATQPTSYTTTYSSATPVAEHQTQYTQPTSYTTSYQTSYTSTTPAVEHQTQYTQPATEHVVSHSADNHYTESTTRYEQSGDNNYAQTIHYDDQPHYTQADVSAQQHGEHDTYQSADYRVAAQNNRNWESNFAGNTAGFSFSKQADQGSASKYNNQSDVITSFKRSTKRYKYVNGQMVEAYEDGVSRL